MSASSLYTRFPVTDTVSISSTIDIRHAADMMAENYSKCQAGTFSYRLLLPRGEKMTSEAKKLGHALQGELLLALKKKKISPRLKEVRYVHDTSHYGWLIANPEVFEQFEKENPI